MMTPDRPPTTNWLARYNVNRIGDKEVIWQPTYDYLAYGTGGATQFTFFQRSVGSSGTTLADTNMRAQGQFPRPQEFLITGIQVWFDPGNVVAAALATPTAQENWNDVVDVGTAGYLQLFIGSKPYLDDAPIGKFTQQWGIEGHGDNAVATTQTAADSQLTIDYARFYGRYYAITPIKLPANQNFNVTLNFPTAVAILTAGKIGVILDGFLYRLSQ